MDLTAWFDRSRKGGLAAVVPQEAGIAIAALDQAQPPRLAECDFLPGEGGAVDGEALARRLHELHLTRRPCTTVMPLGEYTVLNVEAPAVPPEELRAAVRWQVKDLIDFHIDDAVIDVFDAPPSGATGRQNSLYVVVSRLAAVRERVDLLEAAEARLETIDIPELVLRNITERLPEDEAGVGFVYLARERGLVILTRQSTLYFARTLEMGYADLAAGDSGQFDRLVLEIQRSLDYYDRYFVQPPVAGLVLAPSEEPVPGLQDYLHEALGLAVRNLDLGEVVACDRPLEPAAQARCLMAVAAALREEPTTL